MNEKQPPTEGYEPEDLGLSPDDDEASGASSEPEWLREMSGDQEAPDWLRRLFERPDEDDLLAEAGLLGDAGLLGQDDLFADLDLPAQEEPEETPPAAETEVPGDAGRSGTDELRQWFQALEGEGELPEDREALPEWLQALDATESAPQEPGLPDETSAGPPKSEEVPSWLRDLDERAEEPVLEEPVVEAPGEAPIPDWLRALDDGYEEAEETAAPDEVAPAPAPQETADLPDWLIEMTEEIAGEPGEAAIEATAGPPATAELWAQEEPPALEERLPAEGLSAMEELPAAEEPPQKLPEPEALPAEQEEPPEPETVAPEPFAEEAEPEPSLWLTDVDREPPEELPAAREEDEALIPDWLVEVDEEPPEGVEAPEWIQDLRGTPEVELELEVETSGPLAGLAGLLSPQPLAGLSSKATFKPAPAVPEEHHVLAARVREMLDEPPARPELSVAAPGRTVMRALGRWLIYLALGVVIVAAMFVPALQDLVLAPETEASQDLYVTLLALPPGSEVLLVVDYDAAHDGELTPLTRVLLWHLITSGQRVVVVSHTPQGTAMAQDLITDRALWAYNPAPVVGEQVLNLGYLPPHPASMLAFMADPLGGAVVWGEGSGAGAGRAQDTPLGHEIAGFGDLDAIVLVSASQEHTRWWIEQTRQAAPMLAAVSASVAPTLLPYYGTTESAQLGGMLVGLAGAAEYERLCRAGFVPSARQNMILQGSAQILFAAIVLVSGISLVVRRALGRKG